MNGHNRKKWNEKIIPKKILHFISLAICVLFVLSFVGFVVLEIVYEKDVFLEFMFIDGILGIALFWVTTTKKSLDIPKDYSKDKLHKVQNTNNQNKKVITEKTLYYITFVIHALFILSVISFVILEWIYKKDVLLGFVIIFFVLGIAETWVNSARESSDFLER